MPLMRSRWREKVIVARRHYRKISQSPFCRVDLRATFFTTNCVGTHLLNQHSDNRPARQHHMDRNTNPKKREASPYSTNRRPPPRARSPHIERRHAPRARPQHNRAPYNDRARPRSRTRSRSPRRERRNDRDRQNLREMSPLRAREEDGYKRQTQTRAAATSKGTARALDGMTEEEQLQTIMGFSSFRSTQNTKVPGNDKNYGVRKVKKAEFRQYMNRSGGFNRPLSPTRG
ncbi:hypothetical protein K470DRAFT_256713 [Piedraia hortae CBS 480.64]|uniref:U4/U6.U5 small nuclear ribonucleoprotein 27kDa protein domain-containing protein n=1 Tax=Piedraia hortae CBS 480.64 TaxID=1314780 RepID=A0A6A7C4E2_9PEZI|nr:hypothetical protein K470DRAFT_256713 [Piedraia hortae CBS 480.64]